MTHEEIEQKDIVEAYVLNRLSDADRQAFEEHFFACDACFAQVQETDAFSRGIRSAAESDVLPLPEGSSGERSGWLWPAFALSIAAVLVLGVATAWLAIVRLPELRSEAAARQRSLEDAQKRSGELEQQLALNRSTAAEPNLPLVMLEASRAAGTANTLSIPGGSSRIALWMEIGSTAPSVFRLEVRSMDNQLVENVAGLERNRYGALTASVPAEHLKAGTYNLRLFAADGSLVSAYRLEIRR